MTFSTQSKKPQLPSFKTSKADFFLVTRYMHDYMQKRNPQIFLHPGFAPRFKLRASENQKMTREIG